MCIYTFVLLQLIFAMKTLFVIVLLIVVISCVSIKDDARIVYTLDIDNNCKLSTFEGYCKHHQECWDTIVESINKYNTTKHVCVLPTNTTVTGSFMFINEHTAPLIDEILVKSHQTKISNVSKGPRLILYFVDKECKSLEGQGCKSPKSCVRRISKMFHKKNEENHPYLCASYAVL